jgi:glycosyltransferase involved in cell wall biosynthesis
MTVLFLTLYPDAAASPRYRISQFLPFLRERGFRCETACAISAETWRAFQEPGSPRARRYHIEETLRRTRQLLGARRHDVVVVQKGLMSASLRGMHALLRMTARRLVYDFDDAVHLCPPVPLRGPWSLLEDRGQVAAIMHSADLVLAGNEWLAAEARRLGARAEVFPTVVDTDRFTPAPAPPPTYRIGWIGGPSTTPALREMGDMPGEIMDAEFLLIGADPSLVPWPSARVVPWSKSDEVALLRSCSVGLMPLPKTPWSQGKCALKALQYMACGLPCVATPWGAALDVVRHGENGLLADSPREWHDALERLRDPALRGRMGAAARAFVEERYALKPAAGRMAELLESLV